MENIENDIEIVGGGGGIEESVTTMVYTVYDTVNSFLKNVNPLVLLTLFYFVVFFVIYFYYREPIKYWYRNTLREKILEWSVYLKLDKSGSAIQSVRSNSDHRMVDSWLDYFETQLGLAE